MRTVRLVGVATVVLLVLVACGGDDAAPVTTTIEVPEATSTSLDPMASPSVDGKFAVDDGRELALQCWGTGSPAVVVDAGSSDAGIARWSNTPMVRELAQRTTVCTYDRAGLGASDPAPEHARVLDDVVGDLHELLSSAEVPGPYVLVGASGGGFDIYQHAGLHPDEVVGLVMLDVPAGQAEMSPEDVAALAWDNPDNPEHIDYVAVERQMALDRLPIPPIPVTVITAESGQSEDPDTQKVWLEGSSDPRQVVLAGTHDIYGDQPEAVLQEVQQLLDLLEAR